MLVPSDTNTYLQENNESIRNDWCRARVTRLKLQKRILMDMWNRMDAEVKKKLQRQEKDEDKESLGEIGGQYRYAKL